MNIPLPKITHPTFELTLPSSGKTYRSRPMLTRERKILLMAMEGKDAREISKAIRHIITVCVEDLQVDVIPIFDLEYVFVQLIINSIKDTLDLLVRIPGRDAECPDCGKERRLKINLTDAKVSKILKNKEDFLINAGSGIGLKLRYPTEEILSSLDVISKEKTDVEKSTDLISISVESVFDASGTTYPFASYSYQERIQFLDELAPEVTDKLEAFVDAIPRLSLDFKIQCPTCKFEVAHKLSGLADFFV